MTAAALIPLALASCVVDRHAGAGATRSNAWISEDGAFTQPLVRDADAVEGVGRTASPLSLVSGLSARDRVRATLCLASAIYYEAATEPEEGQRAVAQVVLNRVRHPAWPHSVCGVVYQGSDRTSCQFSFACDGAMARVPVTAAWIRALRVAERSLAGDVYLPVGSATFYHTLQVAPAWRLRMEPVGVVGTQIFYRQPGDPPQASALPVRYLGGEPTPGPLPRAASPADFAALQAIAVVKPSPPVAAPVLQPKLAAAVPARSVHVTGDDRYVANNLPDSDVRPEFRRSGEWIRDTR